MRRSQIGVLVCLALALAACEGSIDPPNNDGDGSVDTGGGGDTGGDDTGGGGDVGEDTGDDTGRPPSTLVCDGPTPGPAPLRRLSLRAYDNSIEALFGDTSRPGERLMLSQVGAGRASQELVGDVLIRELLASAEDVAARAVQGDALGRLIACDRSAMGDDTCANTFIDRIGAEAFRGDFDSSDRDAMRALYAFGRDDDGGGFRIGIQMVVEFILQSPKFLYQLEFSEDATIQRVSGRTLANRMAYFLWEAPPDEELLRAADAGELDTNEGVETQARRMLASPNASETLFEFFEEYLEFDHLEGLIKDPGVYPNWNERIPELFREETEAFIRATVIDGSGSWEELLTADWTMMNEELATYYRFIGPETDTFERVSLTGRETAGILTQGALMAARARPYESSPIHRGMFVRAAIFCGTVPDPPQEEDITPPDPDPTATTRERLFMHRANPECAACHNLLDPLGFAFENYDGSGVYRVRENGMEIDSTGDLISTDNDGAFEGPRALARRAVDSDDARRCFATHWFRFALGRQNRRNDSCAIRQTTDAFIDGELNVRELLIGLVLSDAFIYRDGDQDQYDGGSL